MTAAVTAMRRRHRDEFVRRVTAIEEADEVFAEASRRLERLVPFDAAAWLTSDPGTGLPIRCAASPRKDSIAR